MLGLGTALKILFNHDPLTGDFLQRNELIALIVTLGKFSDAVSFVHQMELVIARETETEESEIQNEKNNKSAKEKEESVKGESGSGSESESESDLLSVALERFEEWKPLSAVMVFAVTCTFFLFCVGEIIAALQKPGKTRSAKKTNWQWADCGMEMMIFIVVTVVVHSIYVSI